MNFVSWVQNNYPFLSFISTLMLVGVTTVYVYLTKKMLDTTKSQMNFTPNPVIGIDMKKILVGPLCEETGRRSLSIDYKLINIGNAPAIQILTDAEIQLEYTDIEGEKIIPSRFEPPLIPYLCIGEAIIDLMIRPSFGNTLVDRLFFDFIKCDELNIERIAKTPSKSPYTSAKLIIHIYYQNNLGQLFKTCYESYISYLSHIHSPLVPDDFSGTYLSIKKGEVVEINQIYIPRPVFYATPISEKEMNEEISQRDKKRKLCGW